MTTPTEQPQAAPVIQNFNIPGISYAGDHTNAPYVLVIGAPKSGKSTTVISLFDWPNPGDRPLVLGADPTGPDSCKKFGYSVPVLKIKDMPGTRFTDKSKYAVDAIEKGMMNGPKPGALVIDCMSVWVERLIADDSRYSNNANPRSNYAVAGNLIRDLLNRMIDFQIPLVALAWLEEGGVADTVSASGQKGKRMYLGGPSIMGSKMKAQIAGKADMILLLEKVKVGTNQPGSDAEGFIRQFRTKTYDNIECGGRYSLPDPAPCHLGYCLDVIMGRRQLGAGA